MVIMRSGIPVTRPEGHGMDAGSSIGTSPPTCTIASIPHSHNHRSRAGDKGAGTGDTNAYYGKREDVGDNVGSFVERKIGEHEIWGQKYLGMDPGSQGRLGKGRSENVAVAAYSLCLLF
eukprot:g79473.t1